MDRITDHPDMTSAVYPGRKASTQTNKKKTLQYAIFRIGKRTQTGLVMDGWNSLIRYFKNNFSDGFRQVRFYKVIRYSCGAFFIYIELRHTKIDVRYEMVHYKLILWGRLFEINDVVS